MPRFLTYAFCGLTCLLSAAAFCAAAIQPSETLLPATTQGLFSITNVDRLDKQWNKTQLGHLMAEPAMKPFTKDLRRQLDERWSNVHERLGLTLEDMRGVPGGEVAIALIAPAKGKAALAIVIDVTGKLPQAKAMLEKVTAAQLQRGAKRTTVQVQGADAPIVRFDLPELDEEKEAARSTLRGTAKAEADKKASPAKAAVDAAPRQAFYCLSGNLLAVTDNIEVMQGILSRTGGNRGGSLAEHKPFQKVTQRCKADNGNATPQIRWYIHPLGYAEAARVATPESRRRKGKSILEVMRNQGVGAIQGAGGFLDFATEDREMIHRTAVYAPPPYEKAMKMLVLPNAEDFSPQSWVPREIATYSTLYFDIKNAFDNFGSLFDELFGEGARGVWIDTITSMKEDPTGPQVDLRQDLIQYLGPRISMLTDYQLPITTSSERLLFAIETSNPKAVSAALEKLMRNDPTVRPRDQSGKELKKDDPTLHKRALEGGVIWEVVEDQDPGPQAPTISFDNTPVVTPVRPLRKRSGKDGEEEEEDKDQRFLPHAAVTVWKGHLMVASHIDFLLKVFAPTKKTQPLSAHSDYRLVDEQIKKLKPQEKCVRTFSWTDEEYRPTYELVRQNRMPQSETMLARMLNILFGERKKGAVRRQRIDGSKLPDYEVVRRYLGPAGLQATSEADGWYLKGFTLKKEKK